MTSLVVKGLKLWVSDRIWDR